MKPIELSRACSQRLMALLNRGWTMGIARKKAKFYITFHSHDSLSKVFSESTDFTIAVNGGVREARLQEEKK